MLFNVSHEKSGWPGQSRVVIGHGLPIHPCSEYCHCFGHVVNCVGEWAEICNCVLNHIQLQHKNRPDLPDISCETWEGLPGYEAGDTHFRPPPIMH